MSTKERITRPMPDRTRAIRNWSALLDRSAPATAPSDATSAPQAGLGGALGDAVSRSVELGYRVIDAYMRQGQRAAGRMRQGQAGAGEWGQDLQDITLRMAQYASDLVGTWVELLERAGSARRVMEPPLQAPEGPAPQPGAPLRITVHCEQASAVTVELRGTAAGRRLVAHALRAPEPWKPRLDEVSVHDDAGGETTVVDVRVPPAHPPGAYEGLVIDAQTNRPVGFVRAVIGEPPTG